MQAGRLGLLQSRQSHGLAGVPPDLDQNFSTVREALCYLRAPAHTYFAGDRLQ